MIEYILYSGYFKDDSQPVNFCAYKKNHPHDLDSNVIIGFNQTISTDEVAKIIQNIKTIIINSLQSIADQLA
jgi:hypothetical protein